MYKRIFFAIITLIAAGAVMAQAYKWVDEDGVVHYSDRPIEGVDQVIAEHVFGTQSFSIHPNSL